MNKTAIKNFSIWARNKLLDDVRYRAGLLGITADGIQAALPQSTRDAEFYAIGTAQPYAISGAAVRQRQILADAIREKAQDGGYSAAYQYIVEEVAYTWFNRLIAIRFMEVNDYLPAHIRVLSSDSDKLEPDLVTSPFDAELPFTSEEEQMVLRLKRDNQTDELFRFLFIKQCNALNKILPGLFEKTNDYTELLLHISVTDRDGAVYHLTHDIEEDDFNIEKGGQVEIIGWLYQYWNTEPKNAVFDRPSGQKIKKEEIPAATQLFTPDWIVRYMVENSLGRLWVEGHPDSNLKVNWAYYLEEAPQEPAVQAQLAEIRKEYADLKPEDIRCIDPCMGSGHILCYLFDVLMQIYESQGYSRRDAAQSIVQHNLYGLDIDKRATQLAYFAVMMKARQYDRRFFSHPVQPNVYAIQESNWIGGAFSFDMGDSLLSKEHQETLNYLIGSFHNAKEYGSILQLEQRDYAEFIEAWERNASQIADKIGLLLWYGAIKDAISALAKIAIVLTQKYQIVCTNPPYMGNGGMSSKLASFIETNFEAGKADLFATFILRCLNFSTANGLLGFMTSYTWMFLSGYQTIRESILYTHTLESLIQPEYHSFFEEAYVPICTFIMRKNVTHERGNYIRLEQFTGAEIQAIKAREAITDPSCKYRYIFDPDALHIIPGSPLVYWANPALFEQYRTRPLVQSLCPPKPGLSTGDNNHFLRFWHEVCISAISFNGLSSQKWYPINKGGEFRRWYGNHQYIVNWENDGFEIRNFKEKGGRLKSRPQNLQWNFKPTISWSLITTGTISLRYYPEYFMQNAAGICCYPANNKLLYMLALLNAKPAQLYASMLSPTMNTNAGDIARIPVIESNSDPIDEFVIANIRLSRADWDSFETSWNFIRHPLVRLRLAGAYAWGDNQPVMKIASAYKAWELECEGRFNQLKANEEELNRIFIDIYGLQDELTPEVEDKDVTVRKADLGREIRSLLSYAVGCMFGRYSLDVEGLAYAGGEWDTSKYITFQPDKDGILPITDEEYLEDDIVSLLCAWLKAVYGADTLEENLDFIAGALGNKGNTSREIIRNYFLKDFFADHCKIYQKRPIYWLFDSGKQNGFKALIYLHRYTPDTLGNLRIDYLHQMQRIYENEMDRIQDMIDHSKTPREVAAATKRREKLQKQLKECQEYDEKISPLALSRIELDLDDGVKVNYRKLQTASDGRFYEVLADSKNIMGKK